VSEPRAPNQKDRKAQLSRVIISWRAAKWGVAPLNFRLNPVCSFRESTAAQDGDDCFAFPRVWVRSITGCGKLVKKNSHSNHKIFYQSCRKRLFVVVPVQFSPSTIFLADAFFLKPHFNSLPRGARLEFCSVRNSSIFLRLADSQLTSPLKKLCGASLPLAQAPGCLSLLRKSTQPS
jgi:hypothetical protein